MSMSDRIALDRADVEDVFTLTECCKRAFDSDSEYGAPGPGGPPGYDSVKWNQGIVKNQYLDYYKILFDDEIAGGFIVGDRGPEYQVCERIWVDLGNMRKGIGRAAFEMIWELYPSADLWVLGTPEWNTRTNPFYQSIGFRQIGMTHDYPTWNGVYYEKRLIDGIPKAMSSIGDLREGQQRVVVEGVIEEIAAPRSVNARKTGEELKIVEVTLADETGTIMLNLWNDQIRQVKANTRIRIEEGFVKEYKGELQLSVGKWGQIITLL